MSESPEESPEGPPSSEHFPAGKARVCHRLTHIRQNCVQTNARGLSLRYSISETAGTKLRLDPDCMNARIGQPFSGPASTQIWAFASDVDGRQALLVRHTRISTQLLDDAGESCRLCL